MDQNYSDDINNNIDSNNNIDINDVDVNSQDFFPITINYDNYDNQTADHHYNNYYIYQSPGDNNSGRQNSQNSVENNYIDQNSSDGNLIHQINPANQNSDIVSNGFVDQSFTGMINHDNNDVIGQNSSITTSIDYLNNCFDNNFVGQFDPIINAVIVKKNTKEDINKLWNQGFFGKGNLSRSEPTWDWRKRLERKVRGNAGDCNNIGGGSGSKEYLHLTTEEAFFLCFGIESLNVYDKNEYVAYHYFRSLGWVVRCGMKFGVDYVLYEKGPPFKHSQ
ncbi:12092_t:CDS:2 [Entrophospora sp. SA101]|nr:12092_t:CDS:2 [Entrophospora sp. SA101]